MGIAANGEPGFVLGVVGGSGGAGSSTFAAVLARCAPSAMLIDLDLVGGGLDVLLGIEATPGARWSGVRLDGGRLDPEILERGLPRWCGVPVLAVDSGVLPPIGAVLAAARERGPVVLDLARQPDPVRDDAVAACDLVVVVARAEVRPLSAARAVLAGLDTSAGVVLRAGEIPRDDAVAMLGATLLGAVPNVGRFDLAQGRVPRSLRVVARGLLDGICA